jgi:hypothetical protein
MNNYNWCEGLPTDTFNTVLSFFAPGEEIPLSSRSQQNTLQQQKGLHFNHIVFFFFAFLTLTFNLIFTSKTKYSEMCSLSPLGAKNVQSER